MPDVVLNEVNMGFWVARVLLGITCIFDLRYKKIPMLPIIIGSVWGGVLLIANKSGGTEVLNALFPGMLLVIVAFMTKEKVGYGDGFLLMSLGLLEGAGACWKDLMIGLFLAAVFGIILLFFGKKGKETEVPFVPFLLGGHLIRSILEI